MELKGENGSGLASFLRGRGRDRVMVRGVGMWREKGTKVGKFEEH